MGLFSFFKKKKNKEAKEAENIQEEIRKETAEISQEAGEVSQAVKEQQPEKETVEVLQSDSESNHAADEKPQSDAAIIQAEEEKRRVEEEKRRVEEQRRQAEEERRLAEEERRQAEEEKKGLEKSLKKTKEGVFGRLARAIAGKSKVDDDVLDKLEEALILSDVGPNTTIQIIERIEKRVATDKYMNTSELNRILKEEVASMLAENKGSDSGYFEAPENGDPYVIMVVGVNGVGKTTTIGKLANMFKKQGYNVMLGAADTFRAAAIDQLKIWADRAGVDIVAQSMGADPASVAYDTIASAKANHSDVVIIDTAGRLHNKVNLMNELTKIKKVMQKIVPSAPQEILLVIDASTGQNAIEQTKQFTEATDVNALAVTKLDGTAKGGVVLGISNEFNIPVKYIGVGEKIDDLQIFDKEQFVDSLFNF